MPKYNVVMLTDTIKNVELSGNTLNNILLNPIPTIGCDSTQDIIGYYPLNDLTDTIVDIVGSSNLTNVGGNLQQTGILNKCIGFDTLGDDYLSGITSYDGLSHDITISFWIKVNAINTTYSILNSGVSTATNKVKPYVYLGSNNILQVGVRGSGSQTIYQFPNITADTWYNIAIGIDITNQDFYASVDGTPFTDRKNNLVNVATSYDGRLFFGRYEVASIFRLDGYIDNIKIWDKILSDCEVADNYNDGSGIPEV